MDRQHRIIIPKKLRDLAKMDISKPYALCVEDDKIFYLVETSQYNDQLAVDVLKLDEKGRFFIPSHVLKRYKIPGDAVEFIFVQRQKVYISFA